MKPLISVIIPVYNNEKYLCECLDSIIAQTYRNIQIITVDDGSTDASGKILDQYADKDKRIEVYHIQNSGVSTARNIGLKHAAGEYITFVDSDDALSLDMYYILLDQFNGNSWQVQWGFEPENCLIVPLGVLDSGDSDFESD